MVSEHNFRRLFVSLMTSLLTALVVAAPSLPAQSPIDLKRFSASVAEGKVAGWYRWVVDGSVFPAESAKLVIASDARCSLYVNGQRILKYEQMPQVDGRVVAKAFDVKSLLRAGRNLVAVELQADSSTAQFLIGLQTLRDGQTVVPGGPWKTAPAPPPVGWQQTDFNDRDWPEFKPVSESEPAGLVVQIPDKFSAPVLAPRARRALPFQFEDGDHVAFVGATFVERAQLSEHLEATLAGGLAQRNVTFRNLGWSADTAFAESRGIFDAPATGYLRMVEHIRAEEPTVVFLCYGQNEALTAGMTPENYAKQLTQFIDELTASGIPCVLLSPHELFPARAPIPSPSRFNSRIRVYSEATGSVAQSRQLAFVDLFSGFTDQMLAINQQLAPVVTDSLTPFAAMADNGMHFTERGYAAAALTVRQRLLGVPAESAVVRVDPVKGTATSDSVEIEAVRFEATSGTMSFRLREKSLSPLPLVFELAEGTGKLTSLPESAVQVLPQTGAEANGRVRFQGMAGQYESLRQAILRKNELYFHRWRPQNITYLFGFRKHEQGNNAADIARFDPFIRELEAQIHELQQPQWQDVVLQLKK